MQKRIKQYRVLSPDNIDIDFEIYPDKITAKKSFNIWLKRYDKQGYYSSSNYGRIPLNKVKNYIKIIEY